MMDENLSQLSFGKRLRFLREELRYTRVAFAARVGIPEKTLQRYEYEKSEPRGSRVKMLADALDVSADYLLDGIEN